MSNNIWNCPNKRGAFCTAPVWCDTFNGQNYSSYDYVNYNFRFNFTNATTEDYLRVPLMTLMRNDPNAGAPTCQLLIYQLNSNSQWSKWMIIGDAILSQFFAEFSYNGNGDGWNNTMTLTATPYSLPETYVGNVLYDTHITLPKNETEPYDPEATGVETSAGSKFSTLEKVEIWGAGALGLLVAIIIILFIVISCQGGSVTN